MKKIVVFLMLSVILCPCVKAEISSDSISDNSHDVEFWDAVGDPIIVNNVNFIDLVSMNYSYDKTTKLLEIMLTLTEAPGNFTDRLLANDSIQGIEYTISFSANWDCTTFSCEYAGFAINYYLSLEGTTLYTDATQSNLTVDLIDNVLKFSLTMVSDEDIPVRRPRDAQYDYYIAAYQHMENISEYRDFMDKTIEIGNYKKYKVPFPTMYFTLSLTIFVLINKIRKSNEIS